MAERRHRMSVCEPKNNGPRVVLGNVCGGLRAHRQMKRVSSTVFDRRQREWRPDLSKNMSEQLQPMHGSQFANTCKHVLEFEGLGKKSVSAGIRARFAHFLPLFELMIKTLDCDR